MDIFPRLVGDLSRELLTSKVTLGFSNVSGPKEPYVIAGNKNSTLGFSMPSKYTMVGSVGVISHYDSIQIVLTMDKACMKSTDKFSGMIKKNLDEMLGKEW